MEFWFVLNIACIFINVAVAKKKRRDPFGWGVLALFFGVISTFVLLVLPENEEGLVQCSYCTELINPESKVCKHCHKDVHAVWLPKLGVPSLLLLHKRLSAWGRQDLAAEASLVGHVEETAVWDRFMPNNPKGLELAILSELHSRNEPLPPTPVFPEIYQRVQGREGEPGTTMSNTKSASSPTSVADEIAKLKELNDSGTLTDQEFEAAKAKVLGRAA